jgi:hypothetical protein
MYTMKFRLYFSGTVVLSGAYEPGGGGEAGGGGGGTGHTCPPNFFKGLKVPFFVMKSALFVMKSAFLYKLMSL